MPKIQVTNKGQYTITIPGYIVRALQLKKGDEFLMQINKSGNLELVKNLRGAIYEEK